MKRILIYLTVCLFLGSCEVVFAQPSSFSPKQPRYNSVTVDSLIVLDTTKGINFGTGASRKHLTLSGITNGQTLVYDASLRKLKPGSAGGSPTWNSLSLPTGNLTLSPIGYETVFEYLFSNTETGLTLRDASSSGTGYILNIYTQGISTMKPISITAQGTGNGVEMSTAGVLSAKGTGQINATHLRGNYPLTSADVSAQTAYKNQDNNFSVKQTITSAVADALTASSTFVTGAGGVFNGTTGYGARSAATSGVGFYTNSVTGTPLQVAVNNVLKFQVMSSRIQADLPLWMNDQQIQLRGASTYPRQLFIDTVAPDTAWIALGGLGGLDIYPWVNLQNYSGVLPTGGIARNNDEVYVQESTGKQRAYTEGMLYGPYVMRGDTIQIAFSGAASTDVVWADWDASNPGTGKLIVVPSTNQYFVYAETPAQTDSVRARIYIMDKAR